jgi:hypothetical protein
MINGKTRLIVRWPGWHAIDHFRFETRRRVGIIFVMVMVMVSWSCTF